jgi:nitric oxide reductase subunit B
MWLWIEVTMLFGSGVLGMGHHYFWIGTPEYWWEIGALFSALEPVPLVGMLVHVIYDMGKHDGKVNNAPAFNWFLVNAFGNFLGAGVWGFMHTLPQINIYTHGSQFTAGHGHLAFYGAYVLLVMSMIYVTLPSIRGVKEFNSSRAYQSFWWLTISMVLIVMTITGAGMVQVYMERLMGLDYVAVKANYNLWFWIFRAIFGVGFLIGVSIFVIDFFRLGKGPASKVTEVTAASERA